MDQGTQGIIQHLRVLQDIVDDIRDENKDIKLELQGIKKGNEICDKGMKTKRSVKSNDDGEKMVKRLAIQGDGLSLPAIEIEHASDSRFADDEKPEGRDRPMFAPKRTLHEGRRSQNQRLLHGYILRRPIHHSPLGARPPQVNR